MGWIKLDRQIMDNFLYEVEPFDKCHAWIDLLLLANHEDAEILVNGQYMTIRRSQHFTSLRKLSIRWKWSKDKVRRFLAVLRDSGMITYDNNIATLITIVNYDKFQNRQDSNKYSDKYTDKDTDKYTVNTQTRTKEHKKYIYTAPQMASLDKWLEEHPDD